MSTPEEKIEGLEQRLAALEQAVSAIRDAVAHAAPATPTSGATPEEAVVTLLARQLQRLVPKSCEHPPRDPDAGLTLEGTDVPCTEEVAGRVKRIPIPFVREMVIKKVADYAREHSLAEVDLPVWEKASTF